MTKKVEISKVTLRDSTSNETKYELTPDSPIIVDMGEDFLPTRVPIPLSVLNAIPGGEDVDPRDYNICLTIDHHYDWLYTYVVDAPEEAGILESVANGDTVRLYTNMSSPVYAEATVSAVSPESDQITVIVPTNDLWEDQVVAAELSGVIGITQFNPSPFWYKIPILNRFDGTEHREVLWNILYETNTESEVIDRTYVPINTKEKTSICVVDTGE